MKLNVTAKSFDVYGSCRYAVAPGTCCNCWCSCCCNFSIGLSEATIEA